MYAGQRLLVGFLGVIMFVASCGMVQVRYLGGTTEYQSVEEFSAYVEEVSRYHNRVVDDLIVATSLMGEEELDEEASLVQAEEKVVAVCQPFNQAVSATIDGRELGFFHKLQMPEAVSACAATSKELEALLPDPI